MADEDQLKRLDELNKKDSGAKKTELTPEEEAALLEAELIFVKKWGGVALIGPFVPAIFAIMTITTGQYLLNTWNLNGEQCGYALDGFVTAVIVVCYMFLLVYSWAWLGFEMTVRVPFSKREFVIMRPFSNLKWLIGIFLVLGFISFIIWIIGSALLNLSIFCQATSPALYAYATYLVAVYWLGFSIVALVLIKMKYGDAIKTYIANQLEEPDQAELEEKIFRKKFNEYDKEKNGTIDKSLLSAFITDLGIYVPEEDMPGLITSLDTKNDGKLTFNKLQAWFKKVNAQADDLPAEGKGRKKKK